MKSHNVKGLKGLALTMVLGLALVGLVAPRQAEAIPAIILQADGGPVVAIADGGALDQSPVAGIVAFSGNQGGWQLVLEIGATKPFQGSVTSPEMHLLVGAFGTGTLNFAFTDTGFSNPAPTGYQLVSGGALGNGAVGSFSAFYSGTNAPFATTTLLAAFNPFGTGVSGTMPAGGPYSLTMAGTLTHRTVPASSFDATLRPVPEPASLLLLGSGLAGLGLWRRARKNA